MAEGVPITAAEASDLGCSHLSPSVGGSGPFLPRSLPCPTLCSPQPLGRWMVRSRIPGLGRGESVLGEGPGVRPCTGSDSQRPPNVSLREGLGGGGWTPEAGVGSSSSIRQETELGEQEQLGVRTAASPLPTAAPASPRLERLLPGLAPSLQTTLLLGSRSSQCLTSQSLLGKVLDVHVLVLGQLL